MAHTSLSELEAFLSVAEHGGFRRAAAMLHVSPSAISHAMRSLETRLGVRLLNRTTRSVALTDAGARFADRLRPALADVDLAVAELRDESREVLGRIRITTMEHGARLLVDRDIVGFTARHPRVELELVVDVALTDIVAAGFDAGVRLREQVPTDMLAIQLQQQASFVAAASPAYLDAHPAPQ
ncbi:MAG TPA: LysR family transcriptional regulator, partial [Rhodopila sp.]